MKLARKLNCILLVDDDPDDNSYHKIILTEMDIVKNIDVAVNGIEALNYLRKGDRLPPEIIFLDINMPRMNGWEFLEQYKDLSPELKSRTLIMMLTTSANPDDIKKAKGIKEVTGFETKPLTVEMMNDLLNEHFQDYM